MTPNEQLAHETVRAMAGVGLSWDFWKKVGTGRFYLGSIRGTKVCAKREARKKWPGYTGVMVMSRVHAGHGKD